MSVFFFATLLAAIPTLHAQFQFSLDSKQHFALMKFYDDVGMKNIAWTTVINTSSSGDKQVVWKNRAQDLPQTHHAQAAHCRVLAAMSSDCANKKLVGAVCVFC
jgi:hypothetical protein